MPKKKQPARTKPVKKGEIQRDPFEHEQNQAKPKIERIIISDELTEILVKGFSKDVPPRNQIAQLKPLAERLDVGLDHLAKAESLLDERNEISDLDKFNFHMDLTRSEIGYWYFGTQLLLAVLKADKFDTGCKRDRLDNLGKAMVKAWNAFMKEKGHIPTASELWERIPERGHIQEKTEEQIIYWKGSKDNEPSTSYKSFQNRYTRIKKKLSPKTISK